MMTVMDMVVSPREIAIFISNQQENDPWVHEPWNTKRYFIVSQTRWSMDLAERGCSHPFIPLDNEGPTNLVPMVNVAVFLTAITIWL